MDYLEIAKKLALTHKKMITAHNFDKSLNAFGLNNSELLEVGVQVDLLLGDSTCALDIQRALNKVEDM